MIHNVKSYFVVKNIISNMFWNDDAKKWQEVHDRLDVLILSIAEDQDSIESIEYEYLETLKNISLHDRENCELVEIKVEIKIIF